ncbi:MAG: hypothetical protein ACI4FY_00850 [Acetatifactor sp.]
MQTVALTAEDRRPGKTGVSLADMSELSLEDRSPGETGVPLADCRRIVGT